MHTRRLKRKFAKVRASNSPDFHGCFTNSRPILGMYDFLTKLPTFVNKNILIKFMTAETVVVANDLLAINCEDKLLHRSNIVSNFPVNC